jgi:hypothetical protein
MCAIDISSLSLLIRAENNVVPVPFLDCIFSDLGTQCEHDNHGLLDARDDWLRTAQEGQGTQANYANEIHLSEKTIDDLI